MKNYIDIHTHCANTEPDVFSIQSLYAQTTVPYEGYYSVGWHPWHLNDHNKEDIYQKLDDHARLPQVVAIGETGLDRAIKVDDQKQIEVFRFHIELAEKLKKPLIIHCVRAYPDLIQIKKAFHADIPWIIHGYRGNIQTTQQLLKHNFYFSFGESLFQQNMKSLQSLLSLPAEKIFMETDESNRSIKSIYQQAAKLLSCSVIDLREQIAKNVQTCFNI